MNTNGRHLTINGVRLWVEDTGGNGPPVLFSHGLLWSTRMWDAQVTALRSRYRCIAWDHRGQGQSDVPNVRAISIEDCYADAVALIEQLGVAPVHIVGLSMGGFVAMRLAARRPDLVRSCVLLETSAEAEPPEHVPRYRTLNRVARWFGLRMVANKVMPIMFGRTFLTDPARAAERDMWRERLSRNRRDIWRAVNGVIERQPIMPELSRITAPTLIMVGDEDVATVPLKSERMHAAIRGSKLVRIPHAGHSSSVEAPVHVTAAIESWVGRVEKGEHV
ncbi:alpha/beta fold hydrolase [Gemmatimonas sp.]|uniref:alpha/beta fold hydrolase n=1 Tax=Gemmatimonas sp. TaxID=1962908 RepID=UPI00286E0E74|nr:alpha/beta fold hydrolase [Gemmatimonas sp.]